MASLYDTLAARPGGLRDLAAARLRHRVLVVLYDAMQSAGMTERELAEKAGMRRRALRRILNGNGDIKPTVLAELLHATGYEAEIHLVPAGEPRRRELEG